MRSKTELWNAIRHSSQGFKHVWKGEVAFRQYLVFSIILIPLAFWFGDTNVERILLVLSVLLVLLVELINTAIEAVVDRISDEHHPLSGAAKDIGSAAVFLSIIMFLLTWLLVFFD